MNGNQTQCGLRTAGLASGRATLAGFGAPVASFVIATHNRREVVIETISHLEECWSAIGPCETIVVDNASTDGTAEALEGIGVKVLRMKRNLGSCAKAYGADIATGRFIVFLDDDSYPLRDAIQRMLEKFERDEKLGAAGFTASLPNGRQDASALPGVFIGCGVGLRAVAYRAVGGLDRSFFMQAEEYDLAFRLVKGGWKVEVFDDLHMLHCKSDKARRTDRTCFLDTRNNMRVVARHLPQPYVRIYRHDWLERYQWLAENDGHQSAFRKGVRAGRSLAETERQAYAGRRMSQAAFERFFQWEAIDCRMAELARSGTRRVILAGLGKNLFAFFRAAENAGIVAVAVADDRFARLGRCYRGLPVLTTSEAVALAHDAVVVCEVVTAHCVPYEKHWKACTDKPVYAWYAGRPASASDNVSDALHQIEAESTDNTIGELSPIAVD